MTTKKEQYETLERLAEASKWRKEYDRLRKIVDGWTDKQTTTFEYYNNTLTAAYESTTTTSIDYKGLLEELGATAEQVEKYTTRKATMRFKAVI